MTAHCRSRSSVSFRQDVYKSFPDLCAATHLDLDCEAVLDSEIVCLDSEGRSQFYELLRRRGRGDVVIGQRHMAPDTSLLGGAGEHHVQDAFVPVIGPGEVAGRTRSPNQSRLVASKVPLTGSSIPPLGGTRHLSAAQFGHDQRDSIALVASQDGRFTVFAWFNSKRGGSRLSC